MAFVVWAAVGDVDFGVTSAVAVLVISCPHALGLAIPLVISLSTSLAARSGILVKDRLSLERSRLVDVVLFDKTGTLTRGEHVLTDFAGRERDAVLHRRARSKPRASTRSHARSSPLRASEARSRWRATSTR
jgi:Cu2+-exporting ATPase